MKQKEVDEKVKLLVNQQSKFAELTYQYNNLLLTNKELSQKLENQKEETNRLLEKLSDLKRQLDDSSYNNQMLKSQNKELGSTVSELTKLNEELKIKYNDLEIKSVYFFYQQKKEIETNNIEQIKIVSELKVYIINIRIILVKKRK